MQPGVEPTELKISQVICIPRRITTVPDSTQSESTSSSIEYQDGRKSSHSNIYAFMYQLYY